MSTFPKSIEAPVVRFFYTRARENKGKKNGGMVAVLKLPETEWNDVQVYQPDTDGEQWWSHLVQGMAIRVSVREVAKNKEDLIAFALPLKNQPSATQEKIRASIAEEKKAAGSAAPDGDKLEQQLQQEVLKKQEFEKLKNYLPRIQYLIKLGEWLDKHEAGLKLCQSQMADAFFEWCEDDSPSADETLVHKTDDSFKYYIETIASLRQLCRCQNKQDEGSLQLSFPDGRVETLKLLDLKADQ